MNRHQRAKWYALKQKLPTLKEFIWFVIGLAIILWLLGLLNAKLPVWAW